jgi:hypothetical protein
MDENEDMPSFVKVLIILIVVVPVTAFSIACLWLAILAGMAGAG